MNYCSAHGDIIVDCQKCFSGVALTAYLSIENKEIECEYRKTIKTNQQLKAQKEELIASLSKIKQTLYLKSAVIPKSYQSNTSYIDYLNSLSIPGNILSVIYNPELSLSFLLKKNLLPSSKTCECGKFCIMTKCVSSFIYSCTCGRKYLITLNTIWDHPAFTFGKIVLFMFLWSMNQPNMSIAKLTSINRKLVSRITFKIRQEVSRHFLKHLPKFRGVVEIDESCFRPNERDSSKWVFGLFERERKLVYMEMVEKRDAKTLIPIIEKVCETGTTVISDQWPAYSRLEEVGYPHYTVDHSRFFVNPNSREIHTQNIEISWGWAKYWIKKHRRMKDYQQYLNIFCWRRQFSSLNKMSEIAVIFNEAASILKDVKVDRKH